MYLSINTTKQGGCFLLAQSFLILWLIIIGVCFFNQTAKAMSSTNYTIPEGGYLGALNAGRSTSTNYILETEEIDQSLNRPAAEEEEETTPSPGGGGDPGPLPLPVINVIETPEGLPDGFGIVINNNEEITNSTLVTLTLSAQRVTWMAISNTSDFEGGSFEKYSATKEWILPPEEGTRTVYVIFRTAAGRNSDIVSDEIIFKFPGLTTGPDYNDDGIVDDFDLSILLRNWGIPEETIVDLTGDGVVDDFDFSIVMHSWGEALAVR